MSFSSPDFRWAAKESLGRAKEELANGSDSRLRYAALELRYTMEALVYDRALSFKNDIPPEHYKTWQPRKLIGLLLQIDPAIDFSCTLAIGLQPDVSTPAPPEAMRVMGTDVPLTLKDLKVHYDALGSYLHMPSLEQVTSGKIPSLEKLRERCEGIVATIDKVLSSSVWNSTLGSYATLPECVNPDCKQPITRRLPTDKSEIDTHCFSCNAEYIVKYEFGGKSSEWFPQWQLLNCAKDNCSGAIRIWPHQIKALTSWDCDVCGLENEIVLIHRLTPPNPKASAS